MKKILFVFIVFAVAITTQAFAQASKNGFALDSFSLSAKGSGNQTIQVPNGRGAVSFTKTGDRFSNVIFTDASGKAFRLTPAAAGTNGAPRPSCKYPLPDACFGTADKSIGLCMCRPTDLSAGGDGTMVTLLLPAVQKVREAAARIQ